MYIYVYFTKDGLPSQLRKQFDQAIKQGDDNGFMTEEFGWLNIDLGGRLAYLNFGNEDAPEDIEAFLKKYGFGTPDLIKLGETAFLGETGIQPPRGLYIRGKSKGTVDSFLEGRDDDYSAVWRFIIRGTSVASVYDLYRRIRRGEQKPYEWWDKKPADEEQ